jgi:hypothetical protein
MRNRPDSLCPALLSRRRVLAGVASTAFGARFLDGRAATEPSMSDDHVVELRQYTLRKGGRETLIRMFEEHFAEPQNAVGAHVIGTFRDLDDPDRFVWLRGFQDMSIRQRSLEAFYGGPVWQAYKQAANATMIDSDNVLLLRPASTGSGFPATQGTAGGSSHIIGARIHYLDTVEPTQFAAYFASSILPRVVQLGARPIGQFITESAANNFPRLPIREHDHVYVWFARWNAVKDEEEFSRRWSEASGWRDETPAAMLPALMRKPERLRLSPTDRSELQ